MKPLSVILGLIALNVSHLHAGEPAPAAQLGASDLTRYVATHRPQSGLTILRDANGRTVGTANSTPSGMMTFRDSNGRAAGTATTLGNQTIFRDANGRTAWTATSAGDNMIIYRDANGQTLRTAHKMGPVTIFRDGAGRLTQTISPNTATTTARKASGRMSGTASTTGAKR